MKLFRWDEMPEEQIHDLLSRRFISGEQMTMARIFLKKGCFVPTHNHESEQFVVRGGDTLLIPAFMNHSAEALEDTDEMDVFSPIRVDWIDGTDDYLRAKG